MHAWVNFVAGLFLQGHTGHSASGMRPAFYEYILVAIAVVTMVWTIYLAVRMTVQPGEENPKHIKHTILEDEEKDSHA